MSLLSVMCWQRLRLSVTQWWISLPSAKPADECVGVLSQPSMLGCKFKALCLPWCCGWHDLSLQSGFRLQCLFFVNIFFSVLLMIWEWTHFSYSFSFFFFFVVVRVNRLFYAGFRSYLSKGSSTMENCPTSSGEEYKAFNREILSVCLPTS